MNTREPTMLMIDLSDAVRGFAFANQLVREGHPVFVVSRSLLGTAAADPPLGSLLVQCEEGSEKEGIIAGAGIAGATATVVEPAGGSELHKLTDIYVGLYGGGGAPFSHASVLAACGFRLRFLSDTEIRAGELQSVDVFIMPGGGFRAMHGQLEPLGNEGARAINQWVRQGGMYIGSCAGAFDCAVTTDAFIQSCPPKADLQLINARVWNEGMGELEGLQSPGVGIVTIENRRPDHPVMFGMAESFPIVHYNGPVFEALDTSQIDGASLASELAIFSGHHDAFTHAESFMGEAAKDGETVLDRAVKARRASIVAGELGTGRVVAFGSHPEFGFDLPMRNWDAPARLLANAVLWQAATRKQAERPFRSWTYAAANGPIAYPRVAKFTAVASSAHRLAERVDALRARSIDPPPAWLTSDYAMSFFGETPQAIWVSSLGHMTRLSQEAVDLAGSLRDTLDNLQSTAGDDTRTSELLRQVDAWLLDRRDPTWLQDGGYEGVLSLLETAAEKCQQALDRWEFPLGPSSGPYAYFEKNPYHLAAGSYLAAIGCVVGAVQLLRALLSEAELVFRGCQSSSPANRFRTDRLDIAAVGA
jgi:glutamine amidotransferase-like uncharacterized protein